MKTWLKADQAEVRYGAATSMDRCAVCRHYLGGKPPACESVRGPIQPTGWCIRFEREAA